ncbi:MAG: hypothetical protein M3Y60_14730 [Bacteroidota bacterium]|nr:hypothetical protein [Bacteroidota bacterium]
MNNNIVNAENSDARISQEFDRNAIRSAENAMNRLLPPGKGAVMIVRDCPTSGQLALPGIPIIVSSESRMSDNGELARLDYIFTFCNGEISPPELRECFSAAFQALNQQGVLVVAFFDAGSRAAREFYPEIEGQEPQLERIMFELNHCGFRQFDFAQAVFGPDESAVQQQTSAGYGEGLFVVVHAKKKS